MKKILLSLLLMPLTMVAQRHYIQVSTAEYTTGAVDTVTHKAYDFTGGMPTLINGAPNNVRAIYAGAHHFCLTDSVKNPYCAFDNTNGELGLGNTVGQSIPTKVTVDSLGNPMLPIESMTLGASLNGYNNGYWTTAAVSTIASGGIVYVWGNTSNGIIGNGTWGSLHSTLPLRVVFSGGAVIKKIQISSMAMAMDTLGRVFTWGYGGYNYVLGQGNTPTWNTPKQITLPAGTKAVDIAGGINWNYILLDNGHVLAAVHQYMPDYIGIYPTGTTSTSFQDITAFLNLPHTIREIAVNGESTYVILTDNTLWGWGGNVNGTMGIGIEADFSNYGLPPLYGATKVPYAWDQSQHELMQFNPINMAKGKHNWLHIFTTNALTYNAYFIDTDNRLFACGRNKQAICYGLTPANQSNGAIQSTYPNSWDVPWLKEINPFGVVAVAQSTSPYCIHNTSASCAIYTPPAHTPPTSSLIGSVINGNTIVVNGAGSSDAVFLSYSIITQTAGPVTLDMGVQDSYTKVDTIVSANGGAIPNGTYTFRIKNINNSWDSTFSTASVTVGAAPPTVNAGPDQNLNNVVSTTLTGTATPNGSGVTITNTNWTQISGPTVATINTPSSLSTLIGGLIPGTYIFQLAATDSNNNTSTDQVQVVITPAVIPGERNFLRLHRYRSKTLN